MWSWAEHNSSGCWRRCGIGVPGEHKSFGLGGRDRSLYPHPVAVSGLILHRGSGGFFLIVLIFSPPLYRTVSHYRRMKAKVLTLPLSHKAAFIFFACMSASTRNLTFTFFCFPSRLTENMRRLSEYKLLLGILYIIMIIIIIVMISLTHIHAIL